MIHCISEDNEATTPGVLEEFINIETEEIDHEDSIRRGSDDDLDEYINDRNTEKHADYIPITLKNMALVIMKKAKKIFAKKCGYFL